MLVVLVLAEGAASNPDELFNWVTVHGGQLNVRLGRNAAGIRGLFATKAMKKGDKIMSIPSSIVLNIGGPRDSFAVPVLFLLREMKTPNSRFRPYFDSFPSPSEVMDWYNFPSSYIPMLQSSKLEEQVSAYHRALKTLLTGALDDKLEFTLKEMVGDMAVTLEDLQYVASLSATRYLNMEPRNRLLMIPVFDLANHYTNCTHWTQYPEAKNVEFIAGEAVPEGAEVCYGYGELRLDDALLRYGFLLPDEPPVLAAVDHHAFNGSEVPFEQDFSDSADRLHVEAELSRLQSLLAALRAGAARNPPPEPATAHIHALLLQYQDKRRRAIALQINKLRARIGLGEVESHDEF